MSSAPDAPLLIDQDHVLALDAGFMGRHLPEYGFGPPRFYTNPCDRPFRAATDDLPGDELCVLAENV